MADDSEFQILIKFGLSKEAATQAQNELKKIKEQSVDTGKEGVKQEDAVQKATEKTTKSKQELRHAVEGLKREFPLLGHIARMALNPIALAVTAISTASIILYEKLKAVGEVMKTSAWEPAKMNESAKAWETFTGWVTQSATSAKNLEESLRKIAGYTQTINRAATAHGADLSTNPLFARRNEEAKASAMEKAATEAEATAAKMRKDAADITPKHAAAKDAAIQATLDKEKATAETEIAKIEEEIKTVREMSEPSGNAFMDFATGAQYAAKYGLSRPEDIIGALNQQRQGYQGFVSRADQFRGRTETLDARRAAAAALAAKANEFQSFADTQRAGAADVRFQAGLSYYEQAQAQGVTPGVRNQATPWGVTPEIKAYFDRANADLKRVAEEWAAAMAAMRASAEAEAARNRNTSTRP